MKNKITLDIDAYLDSDNPESVLIDYILKKQKNKRKKKKLSEPVKLGSMSFQELASYFEPLTGKEGMKQERKLLRIIFDPESSYEKKKRARDLLVLFNLRFIIQKANELKTLSFDKSVQDNESLNDLIAAGIEGLYVAIEKFDITRSNRLLSYGSHWIRQYIVRVSQSPSVYPESFEDLNVNNITEIILDDDEEEVVKKDIQVSKLNNFVSSILDQLTPVEREVVTQYFGLDNRIPKNIDEIGAQLRSSRERVRQLLNNAIRKIQNNPKNKAILNEILGNE